MNNRFIYHYTAELGKYKISGIAQLTFRIVSQDDLERFKDLIKGEPGDRPSGITSLSFLGMEYE